MMRFEKKKWSSIDYREQWWDFCRDWLEDPMTRVKREKELYLPRITGSTDEEYERYLMETPLQPLAKDVGDTMVSLLTENGPEVKPLVAGVAAHARRVAREYITTGRCVTLWLHGGKPELFRAEDIGTAWRDQYGELVAIILFRQEREIRIVRTKKSGWMVIEQGRAMFQEQPPVVVHGGIDMEPPPLLGYVDANHYHYSLAAEQRYGLRLSALPTPVATGIGLKERPATLGPSEFLTSSEEQASFKWMETHGNGPRSLETKMKSLEEYIERDSIRTITGRYLGSIQIELHHKNSRSRLQVIAQDLSVELTAMMRGATGDPEAEVVYNMKYTPPPKDSNLMRIASDDYREGKISYETYYHTLKQMGLARPEVTATEELAQILQEEDVTAIVRQEQAVKPGIEEEIPF